MPRPIMGREIDDLKRQIHDFRHLIACRFPAILYGRFDWHTRPTLT